MSIPGGRLGLTSLANVWVSLWGTALLLMRPLPNLGKEGGPMIEGGPATGGGATGHFIDTLLFVGGLENKG